MFKYMELGVYPIRFEIMKRKILFLHYLLQQDKNSMLCEVLQATVEKPTKNDFVKTFKNYLKELNIDLGFEEIGKMSKWCIQKLVKKKRLK